MCIPETSSSSSNVDRSADAESDDDAAGISTRTRPAAAALPRHSNDLFNRALREKLLPASSLDSRARRVLSFAERPVHSVYPVLQPREQGGGLGQGAPSEKQAGSPPTKQRAIPSTPIRTLDAPDLVNDYYLNLISWSAANVLAVALGQAVYLWNASTGAIQHLLTLPGADDIVTSVRWAQDSCSGDCSGSSSSSSSVASSYNNSSSSSAAHLIAVGTSSGAVELWDCAAGA
jgi:cell division cycle 20, cofactor of APC complex